jgi:hypothetical protein
MMGKAQREGMAMSALHLMPSVLEAGLRWTARVLAACLVCLVLVILIGEGFHPFRLRAVEAIQMTFFLTACVGLVVAWRWPLTGGALATAGILCFYAVEFAVTGGFPRGLVFHLMPVPGLLFLLSALIRRRTSAG